MNTIIFQYMFYTLLGVFLLCLSFWWIMDLEAKQHVYEPQQPTWHVMRLLTLSHPCVYANGWLSEEGCQSVRLYFNELSQRTKFNCQLFCCNFVTKVKQINSYPCPPCHAVKKSHHTLSYLSMMMMVWYARKPYPASKSRRIRIKRCR